MSGDCSKIMNCNLQRYINDNIWTKHVMIFLSIYIFTFILNWYTFDSLVVENFDNIYSDMNMNADANTNVNANVNANEKEEENINVNKSGKNRWEKLSYLTKSFYYSVIIYFVFILSTKNEGKYLFTFIILSILVVLGTIYTKSINSDIYGEFKNNFIIPMKQKNIVLNKYKNDKEDVEEIVRNQNIMSATFIIIMGVLLLGSYKYYLRQYKDHAENWSWLIFWFGYNKQCSN